MPRGEACYHHRALFNFSFSEILLVVLIFLIVMGASRVGKIGEAVGGAFSKRQRPRDDERIAVRGKGDGPAS